MTSKELHAHAEKIDKLFTELLDEISVVRRALTEAIARDEAADRVLEHEAVALHNKQSSSSVEFRRPLSPLTPEVVGKYMGPIAWPKQSMVNADILVRMREPGGFLDGQLMIGVVVQDYKSKDGTRVMKIKTHENTLYRVVPERDELLEYE